MFKFGCAEHSLLVRATARLEPGGTEYHGFEEVRTFIGIAMSGRAHDKAEHRIEITNWFADVENLCVEYTHGALLTGKFTAGIMGKVKSGVSRYCITYHLRNGKVDRVHEYINCTSWWLNSIIPAALWYLHRLTMRKLGKQPKRSLGVTIVAALMVLFGSAEVATGFTHNFLGLISTTDATLSTYGGAAVGALYAVGGLLLLTMKKRAARLALACLVLVIVGRIALVVTGLYPLTSFLQDISIIIGTAIAIFFAIYVGWAWKSFR